MRGKTHGQALASFGGITRIRFKGSVAVATLSAHWLPRTYFSLRIRLARMKSNKCRSARRGERRSNELRLRTAATTSNSNAFHPPSRSYGAACVQKTFVSFVSFVVRKNYCRAY